MVIVDAKFGLCMSSIFRTISLKRRLNAKLLVTSKAILNLNNFIVEVMVVISTEKFINRDFYCEHFLKPFLQKIFNYDVIMLESEIAFKLASVVLAFS